MELCCKVFPIKYFQRQSCLRRIVVTKMREKCFGNLFIITLFTMIIVHHSIDTNALILYGCVSDTSASTWVCDMPLERAGQSSENVGNHPGTPPDRSGRSERPT